MYGVRFTGHAKSLRSRGQLVVVGAGTIGAVCLPE